MPDDCGLMRVLGAPTAARSARPQMAMAFGRSSGSRVLSRRIKMQPAGQRNSFHRPRVLQRASGGLAKIAGNGKAKIDCTWSGAALLFKPALCQLDMFATIACLEEAALLSRTGVERIAAAAICARFGTTFCSTLLAPSCSPAP